VAGHWAPARDQLLLDNFKIFGNHQEHYVLLVMPPVLFGQMLALPTGEPLNRTVQTMLGEGQGGITEPEDFNWDTDNEASESESEAETPGDQVVHEEQETEAMEKETYEDEVLEEFRFCAEVLADAGRRTSAQDTSGEVLPDTYDGIHNSSPEGAWKSLNLSVLKWTRPWRAGLVDLMGTDLMPTLDEQAERIGDFIAAIIGLLPTNAPGWWKVMEDKEGCSYKEYRSGSMWKRQVLLALGWGLHKGLEKAKERGHNLVFLNLQNYSLSKAAAGPPLEETRLYISNIHVRMPQGFAYAIQYMLQILAQSPLSFPIIPRPLSTESVATQGGSPEAEEAPWEWGKEWNLMDIKRTSRKSGQDTGEGDSSSFSLTIDQPMAGGRVISPTDATYLIVATGNVPVHDLYKVARPDPDKSGVIKIAIKAHRPKGLGRGTHVRYLQQQMLKMPPPISDELSEHGKRIFGNHTLDIEERKAWRMAAQEHRSAKAKWETQKRTALLWLEAGATSTSLSAVTTQVEQESAKGKRRKFEANQTPAPASQSWHRKDSKPDYYNSYHGMGRGGSSSSASSSWTRQREGNPADMDWADEETGTGAVQAAPGSWWPAPNAGHYTNGPRDGHYGGWSQSHPYQ
jgi:hypothetical protein